jgi:hypothetical protein
LNCVITYSIVGLVEITELKGEVNVRKRKLNKVNDYGDHLGVVPSNDDKLEFLIDKEDYKLLKDFTLRVEWRNEVPYLRYAVQEQYEATSFYAINVIMEAHGLDGGMTTRKNRNYFDLRKSNIVSVDHSSLNATQKVRNQKTKKSSKFKGVYWNRQARKFQAGVHYKGKAYYCGNYHEEVDAARAYDAKALEVFGDVAMTNEKLGLLT